MNMAELLKSGKTRCKCNDLILVYYKKEIETTVRNKNWFKDYVMIQMGNKLKTRKVIRWVAECSQCNQLYIVSQTRKSLIEYLKISGIQFVTK